MRYRQYCPINVILSEAKDLLNTTEILRRRLRMTTSIILALIIILSSSRIASASPRNDSIDVKIGIRENIKRVYITASEDYEVIEDRSTEQGSFLDPFLIWERKAKQEVLLRSSPATSHDLVLASEPDLISTSSYLNFKCKKEPCIFYIKDFQHDKNPYQKFRGQIIVIPEEKSFTVVNKVDLENYLRGVVPGEMPVSWPLEALKAQAVAARTYTLKNMGRRSALGYDLKASVEDQMYKGLGAEHPNTNKAVEKTQGEYLIDKVGLIVDAFYSSHAGKFTASPEDGWGISPSHYLVQVPEPGPDYKWEKNLTVFDLSQKLKDLRLGSIKAVTILEQSREGRVKKILISGNVHHKVLTGEEFRHKLGLKSTYFSLVHSVNNLKISGNGFGHGIGMSQHGAKYLAQQGKSYREILTSYYQQASLTSIY